MQDLRYACRTLRKQPIFSLVAILTLTLGIGANTAIFSVIYQMLLRPLPYADSGRLLFVWNRYGAMNLDKASVSIPDYIDRKTQAPAIEDATLFTPRTANLNEGGNPEQVNALAVTPSFFSTLGARPVIGRAFLEDEARPGTDKFVILTEALWRTRHPDQRRRLPRRRRAAGGVRDSRTSGCVARPVCVHPGADVRSGTRE